MKSIPLTHRARAAGILLLGLVHSPDYQEAFPPSTQPQQPEVPHLQSVGKVRSKDGTPIAYQSSGQGPVLVLVAGALSDRSSLARLGTLLAERFTVVEFDRRGRGKSGDTQPYAVLREVEDLEALIDAAGGTARLFGVSSGAVLALEAAAALPGKVAALALYEPPFVVDDSRPRVPADFLARVRELVAQDRRGDAVAAFMADAVGLPAAAVDQMRGMPMWASLEALAHTLPYDVQVMGDTQAGVPLPRERWAKVRPETLVLAGGASPPWLRAGAAGLVKVLRNAKLVTLEGLDHSSPITVPQRVAPTLIELLGQ